MRQFATLCGVALTLAGCATAPSPQCSPMRDDAGRIARSRAVVAEFKRMNPCPGTGAMRGPCVGYVVDHVNPLCNCGADAVSNMAWQTIAGAKEKDKWERKVCGVGISTIINH